MYMNKQTGWVAQRSLGLPFPIADPLTISQAQTFLLILLL